MAVQWDLKALRARTKDAGRRTLHEAGSPNRDELDLYGRFLAGAFPGRKPPLKKHVVVLGMTPGLRRLACRLGCRVTCVDNSQASIDFYRDWNPPGSPETEKIVQANWVDLAQSLGGRVDAVLGDGVFGNVLSVGQHGKLLRVLKACVAAGGPLIFRKILIPPSFPLAENEAGRLVERFRAGQLTEAEFGFAMRMWGTFEHAYDPETLLLDNAVVFRRYERWRGDGRLSDREHGIVERYYFAGLNLVPPRDLWESLLHEAGLGFERGSLSGRSWYRYYPVYCCRTGRDGRRPRDRRGPRGGGKRSREDAR